MDIDASLPAPAPRTRRGRQVGLTVAGVAIVGALAAFFPFHMVLRMLLLPLGRGWHGLVSTFNGVVFLALAALPVAALAVWILARFRIAAGTGSPWRKSLAEVGMVYGTVPWVWITMLPGSGAGVVPERVSLVPLRDLTAIVAAGPLSATMQIGGNMLVFAALGFFAPLRFGRLASIPRVMALVAGCSVLVEVSQYVLQLDRVSSVDDVLVNTAGGVLAALVSRFWWRSVHRRAGGVEAVEPVASIERPAD
ncbi:VanZ like family protein [Raineyella antarctica]|uniref:VanZ like family protein n=1 Tax=Raineyella antarctica TaxID=1577474 RepID=A0A1G6IDA7_9ACTN|nr:VanZ family protein [Raineyella antarctica]SDC04353.1 VanZ like family protein [Raineyella antarctica]